MSRTWARRRIGLAVRVAAAHVRSAVLPLRQLPWSLFLGHSRDRAMLVRGAYGRGRAFELEPSPPEGAADGVAAAGRPCTACWTSIARKALVVTRVHV